MVQITTATVHDVMEMRTSEVMTTSNGHLQHEHGEHNERMRDHDDEHARGHDQALGDLPCACGTMMESTYEATTKSSTLQHEHGEHNMHSRDRGDEHVRGHDQALGDP